MTKNKLLYDWTGKEISQKWQVFLVSKYIGVDALNL